MSSEKPTSRPTVRRLYVSSIPSGNCYKVRLLLSHLGAECEIVSLDILAKPPQTRRSAFLAINPNGRVPTVELTDGTHLSESNAILFYLAEGTPCLPGEPLGRARALQWMFFEQYSHEPYIAVMRFWQRWGGIHTRQPKEVETWRTRGQAALDVMDQHLVTRSFFVGEIYSIADIALFAYTQTARDHGYEVGPATNAWLDRVRMQPGYVAME